MYRKTDLSFTKRRKYMDKINKLAEKFSVSAIATFVLGMFLIIYPSNSTKIICLVIAAALAFSGVAGLIADYRRIKAFNPTKLWDILLISLGIFVALRSDVLISVIPVMFSIYLLISAAGSIHNFMIMNRLHYEKKMGGIVFAVLKIAFALVILNNPFSTALMLFRFAGVCLVADSVISIISSFGIIRAEKNAEKAQEELRDLNLSKENKPNMENIETVQAEIVDIEQPITDADDE